MSVRRDALIFQICWEVWFYLGVEDILSWHGWAISCPRKPSLNLEVGRREQKVRLAINQSRKGKCQSKEKDDGQCLHLIKCSDFHCIWHVNMAEHSLELVCNFPLDTLSILSFQSLTLKKLHYIRNPKQLHVNSVKHSSKPVILIHCSFKHEYAMGHCGSNRISRVKGTQNFW